ncbi:hypothetical protein [Deinococcus sp.]|uniref:hypothetical protein n=1 Tax=Deinococcus sp. TaxID=47478 RepID=UPI0028698EF7|nr:hypothetical protein [Deinococcus sp.]
MSGLPLRTQIAAHIAGQLAAAEPLHSPRLIAARAVQITDALLTELHPFPAPTPVMPRLDGAQ